MASQLKEDGFSRLAAAVSEASMTPATPVPSSRLAQLVTLGLAIEKERGIQLPTVPDEEGGKFLCVPPFTLRCNGHC